MEKLLVVDDDEALRRLLRLELSDTYEIIDSGQPERGLALALESRPNAILLDLQMPGYSGYDLLQTFTSFSHTQLIPVIIVSGESGAQTKEYCKQLGAVEYLDKPIDFEALRSCLKRVAKKRPPVPRSEVRVRLHIRLELRGRDAHGRAFKTGATTEDVSLSGFLCSCDVELAIDSIMDVFLMSHAMGYVGKARVIRGSTFGVSRWRYGCRFTEKAGQWVLQ